MELLLEVVPMISEQPAAQQAEQAGGEQNG
jgi:hypothetical protein